MIVFQIIMHLTEPFLHRYIVRGTFSKDDSKAWHSAFVWLWAAIYACIIVTSSASLETGLWLLIRAMSFRFVAQSLALNLLMVKDGHTGRTWHDLRDSGVDGFVQKVIGWPWSYFRFGDEHRKATEKTTIALGVLIAIMLVII